MPIRSFIHQKSVQTNDKFAARELFFVAQHVTMVCPIQDGRHEKTQYAQEPQNDQDHELLSPYNEGKYLSMIWGLRINSYGDSAQYYVYTLCET